MDAVAPGSEIFIPELGFRRAAGALTLSGSVLIERDGVSLWLGRCISAGQTELVCAFDGVDLPVEDVPIAFNVCPVPWWRDFSLQLIDPSGRVFRTERFYGSGRAKRRSFTASFGALPPDTRAAELRIDGPLGEWRLPFELVPIAETVVAQPLDAAVTDANVRLSATALARLPDYTAIRVAVSAISPLRRIDGLGRGGPTGDFHDPVLEVAATRHDLRWRIGTKWMDGAGLEQVLLFNPLPSEPAEVVLRCDRVLVEEDAEPCVITYPDSVGEYRFGRFTLRVVSTKPEVECRFGRAIGLDIDVEGVDRRWLSRETVEVDGANALVGWSRSGAIPGLHLNVLHPGHEPFAITLSHPIVETDGRWDLAIRT